MKNTGNLLLHGLTHLHYSHRMLDIWLPGFIHLTFVCSFCDFLSSIKDDLQEHLIERNHIKITKLSFKVFIRNPPYLNLLSKKMEFLLSEVVSCEVVLF